MNNRRKLLVALGASALAAPLGSHAQQGRLWRVGFLVPRSRPALESDYVFAFPKAMRDLGYVEGKNLTIEWRFADGKTERLPAMAAELVRQKVDVIVATGAPATSAAQKATATIPIVMGNVGDPVGAGFVRSLAHPGGNTTGLSNLAGDLGPKHLEMLLGMVPGLARVALLLNPTNPGSPAILKRVQTAAQKASVTILPMEARTAKEIESTFSMAAQKKAGAVIVVRDSLINQQMRQIAELAAKHRLPSIFALREYAEAGGLMSYEANQADLFQRAAIYVDKILKGAKPGDLPVEQPTKFELVINRKTAKTLGLTIPQSLLISADKVID